MAGITLEENTGGRRLPTATASRLKMQPDIPKARDTLEFYGQGDLAEMIFGEDD